MSVGHKLALYKSRLLARQSLIMMLRNFRAVAVRSSTFCAEIHETPHLTRLPHWMRSHHTSCTRKCYPWWGLVDTHSFVPHFYADITAYVLWRVRSLTCRGCETLLFQHTAENWGLQSWNSPTVSSLSVKVQKQFSVRDIGTQSSLQASGVMLDEDASQG